MKKTIIIGILLTIVSCSREEYLSQYQLDNPISFNAAATTGGTTTGTYKDGLFTDTIKTSKSLIYSKSIEFENVQTIEKIEVYRGANLLYSVTIVPTTKQYKLSWAVDSTGTQNYQIIVTQKNGQTKIIECKIVSFINLPPVASFVYDQSNKRLDMTSSYDMDARFGGTIKTYEIYVNDILRKKDNSTIFYTTLDNGFTGNGKNYKIRLIAVDDDGASSQIEKVITI